MTNQDTLHLVIRILSKVWRTYTSLDTMCSLFLQQSSSTASSPLSIETFLSTNRQVSVWSEQTAISLITFLRLRYSNELVTEVQAIARNVAMTTRSFNQHLKQRSIVAPFEGLLSSPQRSVEDNTSSLPADFFLRSPSPPDSDDPNSHNLSDVSNTSLV